LEIERTTAQGLGCALMCNGCKINKEQRDNPHNIAAAMKGIEALLVCLGDDVSREGIADTPKRVVKAWREMTEGYEQKPSEILGTTFEGEGYQDLVIVRGIQFTSLCEHHLLPFIGTAAVAYLPRGRVVGLSKIPRLVQSYARRLQLQEAMTHEIALAMQEHLDPVGVGVHIEAQHQCMACRGVRQAGADMVTTTVLGAMRDNSSLKDEFIQAVYGRKE